MSEESSRRGFSWFAIFRALGRGLLAMPQPLPLLLVGAWMSMIWIFSSRRIDLGLDPENPLWPIVTNLAHAPLFGILGLLLTAVVLRPKRSAEWPQVTVRDGLLILLPVVLWASMDEFHQSWVEGRHSSVSDVLMDILGAVLVLWIVVYMGRELAREAGLRKRLWTGITICTVFAVITSQLG